ncbi:MAG: DUF3833 family protein [Alphaproteobacteria bacterium]
MTRATHPISDAFRLETFYAGLVHGWGHMIDHRGGGEQALSATLRGEWDGTVLTLDQRYEPDGGEAERRVWLIRPTETGYTGTASAVAGTAEARWDGETLRWAYRMDIAAGERSWRVECEEELTRQTANVALSHLRISKFGLLIAEIRLILSRARPIADAPSE